MLSLKDGPCQGTYMCKRAPVFLRAVKDEKGAIDCLDQVEDTPTESEKVYVYQRISEPATVHLNFGGGKGGWYDLADYKFLPDVDGETLRKNETWQAWATRAQEEELKE